MTALTHLTFPSGKGSDRMVREALELSGHVTVIGPSRQTFPDVLWHARTGADAVLLLGAMAKVADVRSRYGRHLETPPVVVCVTDLDLVDGHQTFDALVTGGKAADLAVYLAAPAPARLAGYFSPAPNLAASAV